jgi:hypothetical protein
MKGKHQQDKDNDSDDEVTTNDSKDTKLSFDLKTFWKNTNEKYFNHQNELNVNQINHLLHYYSKYGKYNILILRLK